MEQGHRKPAPSEFGGDPLLVRLQSPRHVIGATGIELSRLAPENINKPIHRFSPRVIRNAGITSRSMSQPGGKSEMKCPKCGKFALKRGADKVHCRFCGYALTPGEETRYRLYEMLKEQGS
jgi:ribosomal protein L37AE/L43A